PNPQLFTLLENSGLQNGDELIIRREVSANGRNKIFINNQLATQSLLRDLRPFLVDIHGQGDQQTLFDSQTHLELLDSFAGHDALRAEVAEAYEVLSRLQFELAALRRDAAEKFQLVDTLQFQIDELERAQLSLGEDERFEEERRRLSNVEKLTTLCQSSYGRIYEDDEAALARLRLALKEVEELSEYDARFRDYLEGLESARALLEDLSFALRDFADKLEFSPARLATIEDRVGELSRLKRKYGGSIETALAHLAQAQDRLRQIETSDEREQELNRDLAAAQKSYLDSARKLHKQRVRAAKLLEKAVENGIAEVAMENARFQVQVNGDETDLKPSGIDVVEFYFSANVGEEVKPLARVASGGEASRLMLVLKTVSNASEFPRTIVFDEIDTGIGGRVSEAVGLKLKKLSTTNQVLCVTHQPQIARFADNHLVVQKDAHDGRTHVSVNKLDRAGRVEELARMLTGAEITDSARRHARELLKH
ncbi:MAG TPA: DNA repair protein RecN, partial [Pyrinomonadaceae bacterium]